MPNNYQWAFLATFFVVLTSLILMSSFISQLIKNNNLHAVDIPYFGTVDLVALVSSPTFIISSSIILATAYFATVLHTGALATPDTGYFISPMLLL